MSAHALTMPRRGLRKRYYLPLRLVPPSLAIWTDTLIDCSGFHARNVPWKKGKGHHASTFNQAVTVDRYC